MTSSAANTKPTIEQCREALASESDENILRALCSVLKTVRLMKDGAQSGRVEVHLRDGVPRLVKRVDGVYDVLEQ